MNCENSNVYLMKYFDEELNEIEEAQMRQHLKACVKCNEEFSCMSEIFSAMRASGTAEPPEGFEAGVMEKVKMIEKARREADSNMLILLYNAATVLSIALLMVFVADLKQISIFNAFQKIGEYFGSFTNAGSAVLGVTGDMASLIIGIFRVMLDVALSIAESYYYIIVTLLALLLAVQKLIAVVTARDWRETR